MPETLIIRMPDDWHHHGRQGRKLRLIMPYLCRYCARAMFMPNTQPAIANGRYVQAYKEMIYQASPDPLFRPLITFKITPRTTLEDVISASEARAVAGKLYPDGVTTNSEGGVKNFTALYPVFEQMSKYNLVLSIHGEHPDAYCMDRESKFLLILQKIARNFPLLKIVLEHISTAEAIEVVGDLGPNVAGTITLHHMELTTDDVIGGHLHPHFFCKPIAKRPEDRDAILAAALSGNPKFFFGTDSAIWYVGEKECSDGCAGIFSAPVALQVIVEIFEKHQALERLEPFTSEFGAGFYGLPVNQRTITLVREPWIVQQDYPDVIPYKLGQKLLWQIA